MIDWDTHWTGRMPPNYTVIELEARLAAAKERAEKAEAQVEELKQQAHLSVSHALAEERAERAEAQVQRVREVCEQQMKDRSPWSDDREKYGLDRIDGWNDALDIVEQALDGGGA